MMRNNTQILFVCLLIGIVLQGQNSSSYSVGDDSNDDKAKSLGISTGLTDLYLGVGAISLEYFGEGNAIEFGFGFGIGEMPPSVGMRMKGLDDYVSLKNSQSYWFQWKRYFGHRGKSRPFLGLLLHYGTNNYEKDGGFYVDKGEMLFLNGAITGGYLVALSELFYVDAYIGLGGLYISDSPQSGFSETHY
ncbi:hypothetical protein N8482_03050, partial [Chitinophagales bacterium]|nr:hypothetical protein [Chitinophagales bacterium]